jgi:hypothetical protein
VSGAHRTRLAGRAGILAFAFAAAISVQSCTGTPSAPGPSGASPTDASVAPAMVLRIHRAGYSLPASVQREVAVGSGGSIYLAGGLDASGASADGVFRLDPANGNLASLGSLPHPVHDAAGAVIGNRLFVFGGGASSVEDLVQTFGLHTDRSAVAGHLPHPLADLAAVSAGGTVYLIGGYDGSTPQGAVYATTDGRSFRKVAELPVPVRYPAVTMANGKIIVAGGISTSGPVDGVWSIDPATGAVDKIGRLPSPLSQASGFTLGGVPYVAGGLAIPGGPTDRVSSIDVAAKKVRSAGRLPLAFGDAGVAMLGDHAWMLGGWNGATLPQISVASLVAVRLSTPTSPSPTASAAASDATVRPFAGLLVVADRGNNRLLVVNAQKQIVWRYPSPSLPPPPHRFYFPDDAFWVHGGHAILLNEEDNDVIAEIAYPSGRWLWSYGTAGVPGSTRGFLHQPDDVYPYPGGGVVVADALNCRILFFNARGAPSRQIGRTGNCTPGLPATVGYPNGDTPLANGDLLISELNGARIDRVTSTGRVRWSLRVPGVSVPSDPQRNPDGSYLTVDYQTPGRVVRFTRYGRVLWSYGPSSGAGMLQHPSLGAELPNGLVAVCDDYGHRMVLIDPTTDRIVWQVGRKNVPGRRGGLLRYPDGFDLLLPGGVTPLHVDFSSDATTVGRP